MQIDQLAREGGFQLGADTTGHSFADHFESFSGLFPAKAQEIMLGKQQTPERRVVRDYEVKEEWEQRVGSEATEKELAKLRESLDATLPSNLNTKVGVMHRVIRIALKHSRVEPTLLRAEKPLYELHFVNDLGLDSLATTTLLLDLEREFSVTLPDSAFSDLVSVSSVVEFFSSLPLLR